jgi:hypothetical protein
MQSAGCDSSGDSDGGTLTAENWNCLRFMGRPR